MCVRFPKPEPRLRSRQRRRRQQQRARAACVAAVWLRAGGRCEGVGEYGVRCGRLVELYDGTNSWRLNVGHVHEVRYRSRGGDETDATQCLLLCAPCHRRAHGVTRPLGWNP